MSICNFIAIFVLNGKILFMKNNPYDQYLVPEKKLSRCHLKFQQAFQSLMDKGYHYDDISVTQLCREAGLSRTTFYFNYSTVRDVLIEYEDVLLLECQMSIKDFGKIIVRPDQMKQELAEYIDLLLEHRKQYSYLLIKNADSQFIERWKGNIKYIFFDFYYTNELYDFILEVISSAVIYGISYLLRNPEKYSKEQYLEAIFQMYEITMRVDDFANYKRIKK